MRPSSSSSSSGSRSFTLSSVSVAVDKATSELLLTPDWTIIIAICDSLNSNRWQCKDAIKAVKRRLQHKSCKVQLLTLTLLEAMLKNCGDFVHSHIADKHLLEDMVKIVKRKGDYEVRNKILILLDAWNEAFCGKYPHYNWAYQELKRCGVKFPQRSKEAPLMLAPPQQPCSSSTHSSSSMNSMAVGPLRRLDETMATEIESLSLSSLESMRNVMDLVNDMVLAVNHSDKSALKDELIVDLVEQCRSNQKKLIQMLTTTADEDVMARGLELNDSLQVVLARHDALASGVSLPMLQAPESRETISGLKIGDTAAPESDSDESFSSSSSESKRDEGEDVKKDFMQLAKRHALLNAEHSDEEEETMLLDNNHEETEGKPQCKDIALFDTPTTTSKSEQDIIELLSLTLSTTSLPSPQTQPQPQPHPQSFFADDNILMNSYVVPWAQSHQAEPPQVPKMTQFAPQVPQFQPWTLQQPQPFTNGYPQPQWSGGQVNSYENKVFERNLQYPNTFHSGTSSASASTDGVEGQAQRPYVPPYKLFEDLNVFRNTDGGVWSSK